MSAIAEDCSQGEFLNLSTPQVSETPRSSEAKPAKRKNSVLSKIKVICGVFQDAGVLLKTVNVVMKFLKKLRVLPTRSAKAIPFLKSAAVVFKVIPGGLFATIKSGNRVRKFESLAKAALKAQDREALEAFCQYIEQGNPDSLWRELRLSDDAGATVLERIKAWRGHDEGVDMKQVITELRRRARIILGFDCVALASKVSLAAGAVMLITPAITVGAFLAAASGVALIGITIGNAYFLNENPFDLASKSKACRFVDFILPGAFKRQISRIKTVFVRSLPIQQNKKASVPLEPISQGEGDKSGVKAPIVRVLKQAVREWPIAQKALVLAGKVMKSIGVGIVQFREVSEDAGTTVTGAGKVVSTGAKGISAMKSLPGNIRTAFRIKTGRFQRFEAICKIVKSTGTVLVTVGAVLDLAVALNRITGRFAKIVPFIGVGGTAGTVVSAVAGVTADILRVKDFESVARRYKRATTLPEKAKAMASACDLIKEWKLKDLRKSLCLSKAAAETIQARINNLNALDALTVKNVWSAVKVLRVRSRVILAYDSVEFTTGILDGASSVMAVSPLPLLGVCIGVGLAAASAVVSFGTLIGKTYCLNKNPLSRESHSKVGFLLSKVHGGSKLKRVHGKMAKV